MTKGLNCKITPYAIGIESREIHSPEQNTSQPMNIETTTGYSEQPAETGGMPKGERIRRFRDPSRLRRAGTVVALAVACMTPHPTTAEGGHPEQRGISKLAAIGPDGKLHYQAYGPDGDCIPDFSHCGYGGGRIPIPNVAVKATVMPGSRPGDDTSLIQDAIDGVSKLTPDKDGLRGAVLLKRGRYRIEGALRIGASGVVLRGEGQGEDGTVLVAAGTRQRVLITVSGSSGPAEVGGTRQKITSGYVPAGGRTFAVVDGTKFKPGDKVIVSRNGNAAWIKALSMDQIAPRPGNPQSTRQWKPFALESDRVVAAVAGNRITIDAPITCAIEARWGGGEIRLYEDRRIERVGVENLRGVSEFDPRVKRKQNGTEYFADERHALRLVNFDRMQNGWARDLTAEHFYHGVSLIDSGAKWVTVQDCTSLDPVSVLTGGRRYTFAIQGQLSLVQRCYSRHARHAFVLGARVPGPNVFLDCKSEEDYSTSEPHHRWSTGGLFDNVHSNLAIQDRQWMGTGHGWAGANYVIWNCEGSLICQKPPTAENFAIGFVGQRKGGAFQRDEGWWESEGCHVEPRSLYLKQLEDRRHAE